ncbi:hypothetical protein B9Z55_022164 [Caenorhabditis nigoni]|uniref:Uncharacterized protein n=1 Tax=Caenorhabditis nigoni TaxID=1611254 RepID=A0A2G5SJ08_9PELO|nr:hypothetical protein B9Z55_022164 [Caenorhabditis nigoni]
MGMKPFRLYDIGAKAFETFLVDRHHLVKLFKVDQVKSETWRQHFVLDRCVLHMLQMLHETISVYHEDMSGGNKIDEDFFKKIQTFGGRYRCLAPMVPVKEYFHLFNVWTEMHMDFIVLTCFEGPVCNKEKAIISGVWEKIIQNIKVHFVYGWHHKLYNMTREENEYFTKEKTSEPTRSRLITKLTRLMSRESFSDSMSYRIKNFHSFKQMFQRARKTKHHQRGKLPKANLHYLEWDLPGLSRFFFMV